jgi:hypothetical protein
MKYPKLRQVFKIILDGFLVGLSFLLTLYILR